MTSTHRRWFWCALLPGLLAGPVLAEETAAGPERLAEENRALREQIRVLTEENRALRRELAALQEDHELLTDQTEALEQETDQLKQDVRAAVEQPAVVAQTQRLQKAYDPQANRTVWTFGPEPLEVRGSAGDFYFSVVFAHPGEAPASAETATLYVQTAQAGPLFAGADAAEFRVGDAPHRVNITGYEFTPRRARLRNGKKADRRDETAAFALSPQQIDQLGQAPSLTLHAGRVSINFDDDDRAALRAVAQKMTLR